MLKKGVLSYTLALEIDYNWLALPVKNVTLPNIAHFFNGYFSKLGRYRKNWLKFYRINYYQVDSYILACLIKIIYIPLMFLTIYTTFILFDISSQKSLIGIGLNIYKIGTNSCSFYCVQIKQNVDLWLLL